MEFPTLMAQRNERAPTFAPHVGELLNRDSHRGDLSLAPEKLRAQRLVQNMTLDTFLSAIRTSDLNTLMASPPEVTEWNLAEGKGQSARGHGHLLYSSAGVDVPE